MRTMRAWRSGPARDPVEQVADLLHAGALYLEPDGPDRLLNLAAVARRQLRVDARPALLLERQPVEELVLADFAQLAAEGPYTPLGEQREAVVASHRHRPAFCDSNRPRGPCWHGQRGRRARGANRTAPAGRGGPRRPPSARTWCSSRACR